LLIATVKMPTLQTYMGVYLWNYVPSLPLAVVFAALFALATILHTWKMVKTKMWFCLPFVIGGACAYSLFPPMFRVLMVVKPLALT